MLAAGLLNFTLPANEGAGCLASFAPCSDLDSAYLWRQDPYGQPRIIKRHGVRGMEGQPYSFTYECLGLCGYYVTTRDIHGNESCPSAIVQLGGAVSVPPPSLPSEMVRLPWVDVMGRRMEPGRRQGVYFRQVRPDTTVLR